MVSKPDLGLPSSAVFLGARFSAVTFQWSKRLPWTSHTVQSYLARTEHRGRARVCLWRTTAHNSKILVSLSIKSHIKKIGLQWMCSREKYLVRWGSVQLSTSGMCRRCSLLTHPPLSPAIVRGRNAFQKVGPFTVRAVGCRPIFHVRPRGGYMHASSFYHKVSLW